MSPVREDKKILPMNYPLITSYPNHANLLSILSGNEENLSWFYNFYLQLSFRQGRDALLDFYIANNGIPILKYCPLITYHGLSREFAADKWCSIIDFIMDSIHSGYYVHLVVDRFFIPAYEMYGKIHSDHGILVFGYDTSEKIVYIADFFKGYKYGYTTAAFSAFEDAYHAGDRIDWLCGIVLLKENKYNVRRAFDIGILKELLGDYLNSDNSYNRSILIKQQFHTDEFVYGLQIYEAMEKQIKSVFAGAANFDIKPYHVLWDHKKLILSIIKYLYKFGYLMNAEPLHDKFLLLMRRALLLRNILLKYCISEKRSLLTKALELVKELMIHETQALKEFRENINNSPAPLPLPSGSTIKNTSLYIDYSEAWTTDKTDFGEAVCINKKGSFAQLAFYGSSICYRATRNKYCGYADIYLDGCKIEAINLYAQEDIYADTVFYTNNLPLGYHLLRIVCTGMNSPASSGAYISLDDFKISSNGRLESNFNEAIFIGIDRLTRGSWKSVYGSAGYDVFGVKSLIPPCADIKYINANTHLSVENSTDGRALQNPDFPCNRIVFFRFGWDGFTIDLTVYGDKFMDIALYICDFDNFKRKLLIELINPDTKTAICKQRIDDYQGGLYLRFKIKGRVIINFYPQSSNNAVMSGIFFDYSDAVTEKNEVCFEGADT